MVRIMGFRKVDTDRYEFANDWFVRGEKELLKNNPSLLVQLLQPKENSWRKTEGGGGGAKILEEVTDDGETNTNGLPLVM
ncbi:unnamed protein product [Eruca vesicaria subsp. sativa]|uniref:Uncharacterized protein n=1 Tax=Eruca vesicaria subsp. sativa TaxID=29727 RepID=A0ABC8K7H4_ERUVS|nr:unnamed protein product [Eruca vesicaria subsp. sativa]